MPKCVVVHPKLHLMTNGKLTHIAKGTVLTLTAEQEARLGSKVVPQSDGEELDVAAEAEVAKAAKVAKAAATKAAKK